jgi:hypothetical protein
MSKAEPPCSVLYNNAPKKGVMNEGIKWYNKLPNKIMEVEKVRQFKKELRSYLLEHTFYSVDECHVKLVEYDISVGLFL